MAKIGERKCPLKKSRISEIQQDIDLQSGHSGDLAVDLVRCAFGDCRAIGINGLCEKPGDSQCRNRLCAHLDPESRAAPAQGDAARPARQKLFELVDRNIPLKESYTAGNRQPTVKSVGEISIEDLSSIDTPAPKE